MQELVKIQKDQVVTSSRKIAEVFEKRHDNVLKDIDNLIEGSPKKIGSLFYETNYTHPQNKQEYREILMNRDGFTLLAMGFTGKKALEWKLKYIEAFNKMEQHIKEQRQPKLDSRFLYQIAEQLEEKEKQITEMKPKALFADAVSASHTSILVGELAKLIKQNGVDVGQNRLFAQLREQGFLIKRKGTDYNMPTQYSMDLGLFEIKERNVINPDGSVRITKTSKVTGKGQQYFINKYLSDN